MAEFVQEKDCSWITIREGNTITDDALATMEESYGGLYGDVAVLYDGEEIADKCSFYDVMIDHPRFKEFLAKDCDSIIRTFDTSYYGTKNPAVLPEFIKIFMTTLVDRCVDSPIVQEFEEFLDYRANIKSANK